MLIELVAEGIETPEQLAFLTAKRCETVQSFLFSKAIPIQYLSRLVRRIEADLSRPSLPSYEPERVLYLAPPQPRLSLTA